MKKSDNGTLFGIIILSFGLLLLAKVYSDYPSIKLIELRVGTFVGCVGMVLGILSIVLDRRKKKKTK